MVVCSAGAGPNAGIHPVPRTKARPQVGRAGAAQRARGRRTDMHAVIKTGGKQYRVAPGDTLKVETLTAEVGQQVTLSEVLTVSDGTDVKVGSPFVAGAAVVATVVAHGRHDKVTIFKM